MTTPSFLALLCLARYVFVAKTRSPRSGQASNLEPAPALEYLERLEPGSGGGCGQVEQLEPWAVDSGRG